MTHGIRPEASDAKHPRADDEARSERLPSRKPAGVPIPAGLRAFGAYLDTLRRRLLVGEGTPVRRLEDELLHRLDEGLRRARAGEAPPAGVVPDHEPPQRVLAELLEAGSSQTPDSARASLYTALLRRLVPDEAGLLAAMADGQPHRVLHIHAVGRLGGGEQPVTRFVSELGGAAGVQLPGMAAHYLAHLVALGLVDELAAESAPGGSRAALQQLPAAAASLQAIRDHGMRPRLHDAAVALSHLGRELWQASAPDGYQGG